MIRMIATDLDGTLLSIGSALPEENVRALQRAMEAGVQVVLCSGRMLEATLPIAQAIGVNAPLSLFNGAMTYDLATGQVLRSHTIPRETGLRVLREIEAACRMPFTAVVNNSNLGEETTAEDVLASQAYAREVCRASGLPLKMTTVSARLYAALEGEIENLFPLRLQDKIV